MTVISKKEKFIGLLIIAMGTSWNFSGLCSSHYFFEAAGYFIFCVIGLALLFYVGLLVPVRD